MQALQQGAAELSGVRSEDAFSIDEVNLFERIGGLETLVKLSTRFYDRVYADDEDPKFKAIFAGSTKEEAIQNQYEFFAQRFGGPPLYSNRKGHPALIGRHMHFDVSKKAAERWIYHMEAAFQDTPLEEIDADSRRRMMAFLKHTAYFLVLGVNGHQSKAKQ